MYVVWEWRSAFAFERLKRRRHFTTSARAFAFLSSLSLSLSLCLCLTTLIMSMCVCVWLPISHFPTQMHNPHDDVFLRDDRPARVLCPRDSRFLSHEASTALPVHYYPMNLNLQTSPRHCPLTLLLLPSTRAKTSFSFHFNHYLQPLCPFTSHSAIWLALLIPPNLPPGLHLHC